jgi:hypothetical protein
LTIALATVRACSMKSCATGLNARFFKVMIPDRSAIGGQCDRKRLDRQLPDADFQHDGGDDREKVAAGDQHDAQIG